MHIKKIVKNDIPIAPIDSEQPLIVDVQSALDLMVTADYEAGSRRIVLNQSALTEDFFKLSTNLAGNILQKFIGYEVKIAVVGDFSGHASKPLRDFIHENNRGRDVFFVSTVDQANERLASF